MKSIKVKKEQYNAEEMVNEFLLMVGQKGVTQHTLNVHRYALRDLHDGCNGIPDETQLRRCLPPNMGRAYYNKRLTTYRQYFGMLLALGKIQNDPTKNYHYRKTIFNVKNYNECNIKTFLSEIDISTFSGLRDYVMCLFIIDTGIRPSEIVQLLKDDIDETHCQVHLRGEITKTRTPRTIPISKFVLKQLTKLYSFELKSWNNPYVFCTSEGGVITTMALRHNLRKVALKTGISLTPYDFRHIFATTYIRNGGDVFTLQRILGHTKPNMTMVYVNLDSSDLSNAHQRINVLGNFITKRVTKI